MISRSFALVAVGAMVAASVTLGNESGDRAQTPALNGTWTYRSFLVEAEGPSAECWAPKGRFQVETKPDGRIEGELVFQPDGPRIALQVTGRICPGYGVAPATLDAVGSGVPGTPTEGVSYEIKGWLVPRQTADDEECRTIVRGSVMNPGPDLARRPPGTVGAFILEPGTE
jgi:hypothetical protein